MAHKALELKQEGNVYFQNGNYTEAEACYTQAIQKDPKAPLIFTNRAKTRLKLFKYDAAISDCLHCINLSPPPNAMVKAYYNLSQAQLGLKHPNEAYASAITAYDLCLETQDKSIQHVSQLVLQCKKAKWEVRERARIRRRSELLRKLEDALKTTRDEELDALDEMDMGVVQRREEKLELERAYESELEELRNTFAIADPAHLVKREVPDYLIDSVTFSIMHDPVITKTGVSYDRSTLVEHLKRSEKDPLTAEPLKWEDVRSNRGLKAACDEFLETNGWAVDW